MATRTPRSKSVSPYVLPPGFDARTTLRNQRRRLRTQEQRLQKQSAERARDELARASDRRWSDSFESRHVVTDVTATHIRTVAASYGIEVGVGVWFYLSDDASANSDSTKIEVWLPHTLLPDLQHDFNPDAVREVVAVVKGLGYHELGHLRFTTPFPQLVTLAAPQRHRKLFPSPLPNEAEMRVCWEILEDQRMEAALIAESPIMARYMSRLVLTFIDDRVSEVRRVDGMWPSVAGRAHLPAHVRRELRQEFVDTYGLDRANSALRIVRKYMEATDPKVMLRAVIDLCELRRDLVSPEHSRATSDHRTEPFQNRQPLPDSTERIDRSASPPATSDSGDLDSSDSQGGDTATDRLPPATPATPTTPATPAASGPVNPYRAALQQAEAAVLDDSTLDDTVRDIYEQFGQRPSTLTRATRLVEQSAELIQAAEASAIQIAEALTPLTTDCAPMWLTHQPRGVLDPFAYRMRDPGSRDFHRAYTGRDNPGLDIAVSLLLDVSGSMHGTEGLLGAAAFASKRACEILEIPCTVTLFASDSRLLWAARERAEHVRPIADGGTDPTAAAGSLNEQRHDRMNHLVVVLTDGAFVDRFPGFGHYAEPGRYFLGLALGAAASMPHIALRAAQVNEALAIDDVDQLPTILANFLATVLR